MKARSVKKQSRDFPVSIVKATSTFYNKAFHSKIFTLFASSESEVFTFSQRHKPNYGFCFAFMKDDEGQWYLDTNGILTVRQWVIEQCKKDSKNIFCLYDKWNDDWDIYLKLACHLKKLDFGKLSDKELNKKFKDFYYQYLKVGSVAYIADSFMSTGAVDWLEKLISDELAKKGIFDKQNIEIVRKLTSPVHLSFTIEAEHELLILANKIIKMKTVPDYKELKNMEPDLFNELKRIEGNFYWIQNNYYHVHYINSEEFYDQIISIINEANNDASSLRRMLKEKEKHLEAVKAEREKLIQSLGLSKFMIHILKVARLFAKWKDVRKSGVYVGMYYFDKFLDEIAKRTEISKIDLNYLVFDEIQDVFLNKKNLTLTINRRKEKCFFAITPHGYYIASGRKADKYFKFLTKEKTSNVIQIQGVSASPGYTRGRVRIIHKTEDMSEFESGEILVANQTTPDFIQIMKKASAIVTEQGGITSHAAVISRELGKPCVIGTKVATSVLMNGEIVEVDAHNGLINRMR